MRRKFTPDRPTPRGLRLDSFALDALEARLVLSTFLVTNNADSGAGSLRAAIELANADFGKDLIEFVENLKGVITLSGTALTITNPVDILGPGSGVLSISAAGQSRVMDISAEGSMSITGLTIRDGGAIKTNLDAGDGGGIYSRAALTLNDVQLVDNRALEGNGGGLLSAGGATLNNCFVTGNRALNGGGIYAVADVDPLAVLINSTVVRDNLAVNLGGGIGGTIANLSVTDSTITGNAAASGGGTGIGGAYTRTTIASNTATDFGGGVYIAPMANGVTFTNSTISANSADQGGGVYTDREAGAAQFNQSTVSGNRARFGGGIYIGGQASFSQATVAMNVATDEGGGLRVREGDVPPIRPNSQYSLFGGNTAAGTPSDVVGGLFDNDSIYTLVQDAAHAGGLINGIEHNIVGADPKLGPLGSNGGTTQTHALLAGSPAIDTGWPEADPGTDQRGTGFPRHVGPANDLGAFEFSGTDLFSVLAADGRTTSGVADPATDNLRSVTISTTGHPIVFETASPWSARDLFNEIGAPAATGDIIIWTDSRDGLTYAAYTSDGRMNLLQRASGGTWSLRNLSLETSSTTVPTVSITQFAALDGTVVIGGIAPGGDIVIFQETGTIIGGQRVFEFMNVTTEDLEPNGFTSPEMTRLISYRTTWDSWHLAGIDGAGQIWSVWVSPATFTSWRSDNLSQISGSPAVSEGLTALLTTWSGINLTALDSEGNLNVTWWVPAFGSVWEYDNLKDYTDSPVPLTSLTGFVTPWGGMNYVGLAASGQVVSYWWIPSFGATWETDDVTGSLPLTESRPVSELTAFASDIGTFNVLGSDSEGNVLRTWWDSDADIWSIDNVSANATRL